MITSSRTRRARAVAVCAAALCLTAVVTAQANATTAGPVVSLAHTGALAADTVTACGAGSSGGNVNTCMEITGSGLHIDSATASAHVINSGRTLQECIRGPQGTIACTPFVFVSPGGTLPITWSPNSDEPAGDYYANTFRLNSDGSDTQIGQEFVYMHT